MKSVSRFLVPAVLLALLAACSGEKSTDASAASAMKKVDITAIVEHPALDAVRRGVIEELAEQGFKDGGNIKINFQSAQGNSGTAAQIAKQFVGDNPDVIVAIGTPSAQAIVASTDTVPVVFSGITDPVTAKLVPSWEASGTNVTGMSDAPPLDSQIDLIRKVMPEVKTIGYVYSPGEVNSTVVLDEFQQKLPALGMNIEAVPAQRTVDIPQAAKSLKGKVDLIYTSLDNNVVSAYEALFQAARESRIPLIAADPDSVKRGAVAALGANYYQIGRETGEIVIQILNGEKPGNIAPRKPSKFTLSVSPENAELEGITLPEELVKSADEVVSAPTLK